MGSASKLDQLRDMTIVVADTGDIDAIRRLKPVDCTTNPTLVLKAAGLPATEKIFADAIRWGRGLAGSREGAVRAVGDRLAVAIGTELASMVPGRVSTEVDADLSFDTAATVKKAREIIDAYAANGVSKDKILIKIAGTWEGIRASEILQRDGIDTNMTLIFDIAQAIACADAKSFLISPFVGRIMDWYAKAEGRTFEPEDDPGVKSVRAIYRYYKAHGIDTVVMAASFRNAGEIEALAGCDRLTISPQLLDQLAGDVAPLERKLSAQGAGEPPPVVTLDERAFRWAINENPMATEKLAEGIRLFAKDLAALRKLVAEKLAA